MKKSHQGCQAARVIIIITCGCPSGRLSLPLLLLLITQQWRSIGGREEEEEEEEVEWEGQPPAAPMGAITATRHHSCTAVPNACASAQRKRSSSSRPHYSRSSPPA